MKKPDITVLNRTQITEVIVRRQISHTLLINGEEYDRNEVINSYTPYMGMGMATNKSKVTWKRKIGDRTYQGVYKRDVVKLKLEEHFMSLLTFDINAYNGNNRIWEK
jgi:hypothetical protein